MAPTEQEIINAMSENPELGFRLLMKKYATPVYWHVRRLVVSHADAEDAAQETFVRVFRAFDRRTDDASLAAWIFRIATNEALRLIERRKTEAHAQECSGEEVLRLMADDFIDYDDLEAVKLQRAILSLPTKQQVTFNLRYYNELTYGEIAAVTGTSPDGAKANYHLAKEKIIRYMTTND